MITQKGSAHVIIIIGLVVLLIGSLGFIFWQNFVKEKPVSEVETSKKVTPVPKAEKPIVESTDGYLVLEDWGVKFKAPEGIGEITYYKSAPQQGARPNEGSYEFSTRNVEALGDNCVENIETGSVTRLAYISRSRTKAEQYASSIPANDNNPLDGYYYMVSGGQSLCSESQSEIQMKARNAISDMLMRPITIES